MADFRAALDALTRAGVPHCVRNGGKDLAALRPQDDLDVLVGRADLAAADAALRGAGFRRLRAQGHDGHRFYVSLDEDGTWRKVDVVSRLRYADEALDVEPLVGRRQQVDGLWLAAEQDERHHHDQRERGRREPRTLRRRVTSRLPVALRRSGPVLAVLGPDGAGKGSLLASADRDLPVGVTLAYLGNQAPRLIPRGGEPSPPPVRGHAAAGGAAEVSQAGPFRECAHMLVRKALPTYAVLLRAYAAAWRGDVVLCDRHPVEVLAVRPPGHPLVQRVERLLFARLVPTPDRVIVLDAPGEVLFARKGEHDPVTLERWRQGYLAAFVPPGAVVDTAVRPEDSERALRRVLFEALSSRRGWRT